jgi:hypothetical protein
VFNFIKKNCSCGSFFFSVADFFFSDEIFYRYRLKLFRVSISLTLSNGTYINIKIVLDAPIDDDVWVVACLDTASGSVAIVNSFTIEVGDQGFRDIWTWDNAISFLSFCNVNV